MGISEHLRKEALNPEWEKASRVHDWRNYAIEELRQIWPTFTEEQKVAVASALDEQADREHWD